MLDHQEKARVIESFLRLEQAEVEGRTIAEIADASIEESAVLSSSVDPIAPVLRTALVINWPEKAMRPRYDRFRQRFPHIDSLSAMKAAIDGTPPLAFCTDYLGINANPARPEKNPKFALLKTLTEGFLDYRTRHGLASDIGALRTWAARVDMANLASDPIAQMRGVGPGTVENIRLNLGYSTVKPDRHVIGVAKKTLGLDVSPLDYTKLADFLGIHPRRFDIVLFEYGKLHAISV